MKLPPAFEEDDPRALDEAHAREGQAGAGQERDEAPADDAPARTAGGAEARVATAPTRALAPPGRGARTGEIRREALLTVLDAGPGSLLRGVEVSPYFEGSRFLGWRLDQIVDERSPVGGVDLAIGDIILAVNERPLARPEHVMAIWTALRSANLLTCQVWRGDAAFSLRFSITPAVTAAAPAAAPDVTPAPAPPRPPASAPAATSKPRSKSATIR